EGQKPTAIVTRHTIAEEAKHGVRILLAEDNPVNQKLARTMLTKAGYQVEVAKNGREAVHKATSGSDRFDMIFMDVQMPEMDGLKATEAIRRHEKSRAEAQQVPSSDGGPQYRPAPEPHVPIIAMTAHALKGDRERCLASGMDDYITKPLKREQVYEMAKKWSFRKESAMNINEMAAALDLEPEEFRELLEVFVETTTTDLARLESGAKAGLAQDVVEAAHSIKGAAGSLGLTETQDLAKQIEMNARQNILDDSLVHAGVIRKNLNAITDALEEPLTDEIR
ncbi:MAG: response regulator, partial [Deltaproteobacteria bacterium]|nr:response regulator [Deltaproteobacteria bacterium]